MYDIENIPSSECGWLCKTRHVYEWFWKQIVALGYVYTLGKQTSRSTECCMSRNATSAEFLEVQIPLCVFVYGWNL